MPTSQAAEAAIPFAVVGGFLGAGKTSLLNHLIAAAAGRRLAVLINDFGSLAVDDALVAAHEGDTITFANGCLCCTIGDSLLATLEDLLARDPPPEQVVVEASGVADPRPIAEVAVLHPGLARDLTLVLIDVETILERAGDERLADTVERQLAAADLLVLNKTDLVPPARLAEVRAWIEARWPHAALAEAAHGRLPPALLLVDGGERAVSAAVAARHHHLDAFRSVAVRFERPVELEALRRGLAALPASVLRAKGFARPADDPSRLLLVQRAGRRGGIATWSGTGSPEEGLQFIGLADMPPDTWFAETFAPERLSRR